MNNGNWPLVPLGEVLQRSEDWVTLEPRQRYREVTVRLWGKGIAVRREVEGVEIKASSRVRVRVGQLILSRIDARNGAIGIIPPELDGAVVSSDFPVYQPVEERVSAGYLGWLTRTKAFVDLCRAASEGTTNRVRLKEDRFLQMTAALPPLKEQQRLVGKLDALAAKIEEAKRLREQAEAELSALLGRAAAELFSAARWPTIPLGDLLTEDSRNGLGVRPSDSPPGVPILRISAGTSRRDATVDEQDFKYLQIGPKDLETYRLRKGDLLACRFNGNLHYVGRFSVYQQEQPEDRVYPDKLIRFRVDATRILPEFICLAMNSPAGREATEAFCTTTAGNIGISATQLKTIPVPVPALREQRLIIARLGAVQMHIQRSIGECGKVRGELNAMLPSILDQAFRGQL